MSFSIKNFFSIEFPTQHFHKVAPTLIFLLKKTPKSKKKPQKKPQIPPLCHPTAAENQDNSRNSPFFGMCFLHRPTSRKLQRKPEVSFVGIWGFFGGSSISFPKKQNKIPNFFLRFSPTELYKEYRMLKQQGKASDSSGKTGSQEIPNVEQVLENPL